MTDHYATLGVEKEAAAEEIKKAHRQKVSKLHPDAGGDPDEFMKVQRAYEVLSDPDKRRRYDAGEPEPGDRAQMAFGYIAGMFKAILQNPSDDLFKCDLVARMRDTVRIDRENTKRQVAQWEKRIQFLEKMKTRMKHKGGRSDILTGILDQDLTGLRAGIKSADDSNAVLAVVDGILDEYGFEQDKVDLAMNAFSQASAYSTGTFNGSGIFGNVFGRGW